MKAWTWSDALFAVGVVMLIVVITRWVADVLVMQGMIAP